ncbi:protein kinase [Stieleria sp. JC731]|uniref:protein kinase domain-containing protein n=1 Tax=Pirellulaceae TaxID=2691357 RepID=UPI001E2B9F08|nr:protein kinase [Stieleria sp. JC731]MCC9603399.1 protein kinase [Stieleria sp. JC731]
MNLPYEKNPDALQDPKVGELLDEFLIAEELGSPVTVEELCKGSSDLRTALRNAIDRQRRFESLKEDLDSPLPLVYGSYEVVEVLGEGGFGTVFRCRHKHLQRDAAVKVVVLSDGNPFAEVHFVREIEVVREFGHDRIATIFDSGVLDHGSIVVGWLAMEYLPGGQIDEYVSKTNASEIEVVALIRSVASTLADAHQSGILHHDIKAANILISENGEPHLTDFGLARIAGSHVVEGPSVPIGTPGYIAPELRDGGGRPGVASEIYSLGIVLRHLLSRSSDTPASTTDIRTRSEERDFVGWRSRDLDAVLARMTAENAEERYSSFAQLCAELDCLIDGDMVAVRPVSLVEYSTRWVRRNPTLAGLWSVIVATLLIAIVLLSVNVVSRYEHAREVDQQNQKLLAKEKQLKRGTVSSRLRSIQSFLGRNRVVAKEQLEDESLFPLQDRGFAWRFLHSEVTNDSFDLSELGVGFGGIHQVKFSPDNRKLIVCSKPRCLSLVDIFDQTRKVIPCNVRLAGTLLSHAALTSFFCQDSGGNLLEISWDSGEVLRRIELPLITRARMALSSVGDKIYGITKDGDPFRLDLSSGTAVNGRDPIEGIPAGLWLTPDDKVLHCVTRKGVWHRWDAKSLDEMQRSNVLDTLDPEFINTGSGTQMVRAAEANYEMDFGFCLVLGLDNGLAIATWPDQQRRLSLIARSSPLTNHFAFRPRSQCVVPDGRGGLLFSVLNPSDQEAIGPATDSVLAAAVSSDNRWIATGGSKGKLFARRIRDPNDTIRKLQTFAGVDLGYGPPVRTVQLAESGETLVCHREGWCAVVDGKTCQIKEGFQVSHSQFSRLAYSHRQQMAVLGFRTPASKVVAIQRREDGGFSDRELSSEQLSGSTGPVCLAPKPCFEIECNANVTSLCFSKGEEVLLVALRNGELFTADALTGKILHRCRQLDGESACLSMAAASEGILCGGADGRIRLINVSDGSINQSWRAGAGRIYSLAVNREESLIYSGMASGVIRVFDFQGKLRGQMSGHQGRVLTLTLSHDGETLASGSADHRIAIWDTLSGEKQLLLDRHTDSVTDLCFSRNDSELWSTSAEGTVYIWNTQGCGDSISNTFENAEVR